MYIESLREPHQPAKTNDERLYPFPAGFVPRQHKPTEHPPFLHPELKVPEKDPTTKPLDVQVGGGHYKKLKIQPIEYIHANNIPFAEGCAIKYLSRWRDKGGIEDLKKARHFIDLLIELEAKAAA